MCLICKLSNIRSCVLSTNLQLTAENSPAALQDGLLQHTSNSTIHNWTDVHRSFQEKQCSICLKGSCDRVLWSFHLLQYTVAPSQCTPPVLYMRKLRLTQMVSVHPVFPIPDTGPNSSSFNYKIVTSNSRFHYTVQPGVVLYSIAEPHARYQIKHFREITTF